MSDISHGMPPDLPGSPYSPTTGEGTTQAGTTQDGPPSGEAPTTWEPGDTDQPTTNPDGTPQTPETATSDPIDQPTLGPDGLPATTTPATTTPATETDYAAEAAEDEAELAAIQAEAEAQGEEQTETIKAAADAAAEDYDTLGEAAMEIFQKLADDNANMTKEQEAAYRLYAAEIARQLGKTTEQMLAEADAYAQERSQEGAQRATTSAIQNSFRAARTAGMLPGQAALAAANEAGSTFSQAYQTMLDKYDSEYQAADTQRRSEIEAQAKQALDAMMKGNEQATTIATQSVEAQTRLAEDKANTALEATSQMTEAQQEALNTQLDALLAAQTGSQEWAQLSLQEKILALQAQAQTSQQSMAWLELISGALSALLALFV